MEATEKQLKKWKKEKKLIPVMIAKYCKGKHKSKRREQGIGRGEVCAECKALTEYALFRLEKCPFKVNKEFCSFCKIHCYTPENRQKIKAVMKYAGPRMMFSHPIELILHYTNEPNIPEPPKTRTEESENPEGNDMHPKSWTDIWRCIFLWEEKKNLTQSTRQSSR